MTFAFAPAFLRSRVGKARERKLSAAQEQLKEQHAGKLSELQARS